MTRPTLRGKAAAQPFSQTVLVLPNSVAVITRRYHDPDRGVEIRHYPPPWPPEVAAIVAAAVRPPHPLTWRVKCNS